MTIQNKLRVISLLPILIMIGLAGYLLFTIYLQFDINNQNHLILAGIGSGIIVLGLVLLIYGYIVASNQELENTAELTELLEHIMNDVSENQADDISALKLNTYESKNQAYIKLKEFVDSARKDKAIALENNKARLFITNMSPEIKTALNGIISFTDLLKSTNINEEQHEFISVIEKNSENLLATMNNILDLSKIENNITDHENIIFDALKEFESIIELYALNAFDKNIDLNFYIDPKISFKLKGDIAKIKEIMMNLLSNAIKFTNPNGEINVEIHKVSQESQNDIITSTFVIKVQDNGIGMTKEQQKHILEAFSQPDTTKKYDDIGLGLATSNKFAHIMGGHIEIESAKDIGSTFYLTLPIEEIRTDDSSQEDAYKNTMIGLYEDDIISSKLSDYLKNYLKYFGTKLKIFKSINKANSLSEKDKCKFCLIDIDKAEPEIIESLATANRSKLLVISKPSNKDKLEQLGLSEQNILFKPITLSKIKELLSKNSDKMMAINIGQAPLEYETNKNNEKIDTNDLENSMGDILIAKTNNLENKIIEKVAQKIGYTTTILNDPDLLLDTLKNTKYNIVIVDEETIERLDSEIDDNISVITTNVIEELKNRKL
ncbi:MAG: sensor histidine kinase [Sulfurovaceae bacterium]